MAESKELLRGIDDITECPICAESFKDPKVLPCIHTFCLHCLEKYGQENCPGKKVKKMKTFLHCPLCRKLFTVPPGGFNELPNNYFIIQLMQINQLSGSKESRQLAQKTECDACLCKRTPEKSVAIGFCIECGENLCESCTDMHQTNKFLKKHQVFKLEEKPCEKELIKMAINYCEQHSNEEIKFYCYDCKKTACVVCYVASKHNKHECCEVKKSAEEFCVQLSQDVEKVMISAGQSQEELKQLETDLHGFTLNCEIIQSEISDKFDRLRALLDQHQNELMKKLSLLKQKCVKEIETRKDELERQFVILVSFQRYCDELKEKGTSCEISRSATDLHVRAEDLVKTQKELSATQLSHIDISFQPSSATVVDIKNWIGEFSLKTTTRSKDMNQDEVDSTAFLVQPLVTVHKLTEKMKYLRGIAILGCEVFVGSEISGNIEVRDSNTFTLTRQLPIPGSAKARALAACSHHTCLYVSTDTPKAILHRFDLAKKSTSKWTLNGECYGLSITRSFNLLVTLYDTKRIQEYTTRGILLREIIIDCGRPFHSIQLSSGGFAVCQGVAEHKVCVVSSTGQVIRSYGGAAGSSDGQLNYPFQLSVDKSDNVIVADTQNSRIVLLSATLTLLGYIQTPGHSLVRPWAIHWAGISGCLYVGEQMTDHVLVLKAAIPRKK